MDTRSRYGKPGRATFGVDAVQAQSIRLEPDHQRGSTDGDGYSELRAVSRIMRIEQGLYALSIGPIGAVSSAADGILLPCVQLTSPPSPDLDPVDILTAWTDQGAWLGPEGGTVVLRSPLGGGVVLATLYGAPDTARASLATIEIRRLDRAHGEDAGREQRRLEAPAAAVDRFVASRPDTDPGDLAIEVFLHVERLGDCTFAGGVWCGNIGRKLQVEAFGIRPCERIAEADIEYKAFGPGGRETRWVSEGKLCGTRGRGIPLTGFAVRLAPHLMDRFEVIYQGAFFASGVTMPTRNGEPCLPPRADDYLEAINIRVTERVPG